MERRSVTKRIASPVLALALAFPGCGGGGSESSPASPTTPTPAPVKASIIVILADDLDWDPLGVMARTRSLVADQGVTFTNSFATTPLCAVSRATFLTGRYSHNHGVRGNGGFPEVRDLGIEASSLGPWMKGAGYRTALLGKYENNYPAGEEGYIPPGWDGWYGVFEDRVASQFDWTMNENASVARYKGGAEVFQTDVLTEKAGAFIRATAPTQPFFMLIGVTAPHGPAEAAPRHQGMFGGRGVPRGGSFNESDVLDKPRWVRNIPPLGGRQIGELDELYSARLDSVQSLDEMVGKLFETLQATGRLDRTYVFVTSDNGLLLGQHRVAGGKNSAYEESIAVPLLVRGPGVPAGRQLPHLVGNIDLAPTFVAIAGAPLPGSVDGRSLLPLLSSAPPAQSEWRRDILIESNGGFGGVSGEEGSGVRVPAYNAVRQASPEGEYVYVEYTGSGDRELYDLRGDVDQLDNAINAVDPALVQRLAARVAALKDCRSETCRQ